MRLLYFSRSFSPHDHRFLSALSETDYRTYFLCLEQKEHAPHERKLPDGINKVRWETANAFQTSSCISGLTGQMQDILKAIRPDIVHAGPIQRGAFLTALCDYHPLVSMSWGYDLLLDAKRDFLWDWVTRYTLQQSDVFIGDCQKIKEEAIKYGMNSDKIITFPWGIDLGHYTPLKDGSTSPLRRKWNWEEKFIVLHTRGWEAMYGSDEFFLAFVKVAHQNPNLCLVMVGEGSQKSNFYKLIDKYGIKDQVIFPGFISQEELPKYYRAANVYVSASHIDGSSISLLEAMACGIPVLVSDIPGNKEWVMDGRQGWLFKMGNVSEIMKALRRAFEHKETLLEMGKEARQTVEKKANWKKNFPKLLEAYSMAVNSSYG